MRAVDLAEGHVANPLRSAPRSGRVAADRDAGTVEVRLTPAGEHTDVTVTYALTALTSAGESWLRDFAAGYPGMMRSWQAAITAR